MTVRRGTGASDNGADTRTERAGVPRREVRRARTFGRNAGPGTQRLRL